MRDWHAVRDLQTRVMPAGARQAVQAHARTEGPPVKDIRTLCYRCIHKHRRDRPAGGGRGAHGISLCSECEAEVAGPAKAGSGGMA